MPHNRSTTNGPRASIREEIDRCAEAFQDALNRGQWPSVEDFLPSSPDAAMVLVELVHVELEFRLKRGERARVEEYLARYPQLAGDAAIVVDLAAAEYEFWRRRERTLNWESYAQRFSACRDIHAGQLRAVNGRIAPKGNGLSAEAESTIRIRPRTVVSNSLPSESAVELRRILRQRLRVLSVLYEIFLIYPFVVPGLLRIELGLHHVSGATGLALGSAATLLIGGLGAWRLMRRLPLLGTLRTAEFLLHVDYGRSEDGTFYYAMEYLPGLDLHQLVAQAGPLSPGRPVYFLRQISAALREAHAPGLIHRDVKPSNTLVTERGGSGDFIKLLDFGLVRGPEDWQGQLTQTGLILGTPGYMSPEQAAGETADARSDIYSVGAVGYFLLSGRAPFAGKSAGKLIAAQILESPSPLQDVRRDVPEDLAPVIARCLAREDAERFPDAGQLEQAFAACACATEWSKEDAAHWWRTLRTVELPASPESPA
jgi:hypothetical protein